MRKLTNLLGMMIIYLCACLIKQGDLHENNHGLCQNKRNGGEGVYLTRGKKGGGRIGGEEKGEGRWGGRWRYDNQGEGVAAAARAERRRREGEKKEVDMGF